MFAPQGLIRGIKVVHEGSTRINAGSEGVDEGPAIDIEGVNAGTDCFHF